ncbi:MAG: FG-GAP repeat domain-containing protein, partial [Chitinophagales bacterium]
GDQDLFVGGRMIPGNYPYPTSSYILQNNKGKFTDITKTMAPELNEIGLVCAALWTDYNNDGDYDLVLTGEWMPITVFENNNGKLKNITQQSGLSESTGWWNSLNAGDFDNDGDIDYVAGNFGINLKYCPREKPIELFYDDYDNNGTHDIIMGYWQKDKLYPEKTRERMIEQIKDIETIFPDWHSYGQAEVWDFYGKKRMENSKLHYKANTFYTSYIENLGNNKFAVRKLPNDAQISSTFGIVTMDVNNDGNLDIVSHGNYYETEIETNTQDAGIGNVLLGNGDGTFKALHARFSGFYSALNAKGLALINIGNTPSVITTNSNGRMQVFSLNNSKTIALTPADNYAEISYTDGKTRRQEFYTGSGYLSQSTKAIIITDQMSKVTVFDNAGKSRIVYGNQISSIK